MVMSSQRLGDGGVVVSCQMLGGVEKGSQVWRRASRTTAQPRARPINQIHHGGRWDRTGCVGGVLGVSGTIGGLWVGYIQRVPAGSTLGEELGWWGTGWQGAGVRGQNPKLQAPPAQGEGPGMPQAPDAQEGAEWEWDGVATAKAESLRSV